MSYLSYYTNGYIQAIQADGLLASLSNWCRISHHECPVTHFRITAGLLQDDDDKLICVGCTITAHWLNAWKEQETISTCWKPSLAAIQWPLDHFFSFHQNKNFAGYEIHTKLMERCKSLFFSKHSFWLSRRSQVELTTLTITVFYSSVPISHNSVIYFIIYTCSFPAVKMSYVKKAFCCQTLFYIHASLKCFNTNLTYYNWISKCTETGLKIPMEYYYTTDKFTVQIYL